MRYKTTFALLALLGAATACSDNDPVEGGTASASAVITDDASSQSAMRGEDAAAYRTSSGHFSGNFRGGAQVAISADGQTWVNLGSPSQVTVALQSSGSETTVHSRSAISAGTYTRVRLTLSGARADVNAGATLGGVSFGSALSILVGGSDQQVVIEKQVEPFTVSADSHARIIFDLNSEAWINQGNAEDESVDDQEVDDSTTARREVEKE